MKNLITILVILWSINTFAQEYIFRNGDFVKFAITKEGYKTLTFKTVDYGTKKWVIGTFLKYSKNLYYYTLTTSWEGLKDLKEFKTIYPLVNKWMDQLKKRHPSISVKKYKKIVDLIY